MNKDIDFVHLHLHTQYSMLDGAILIEKLIPRAKELGMKSIAITDHGVMYGVVDFYNECKKHGIKPIIGFEAYISPGLLTDRNYQRGQTSNYHLILLAKNNTGLYNLRQLASIAQIDGFYMRPRIDKNLLKEYSEGIIGLSACLGGEIPQKILNVGYKEAVEAALEYKNIFEEDSFYLEIQQNGIAEQAIVNKQMENISRETGIPLVATCDCHYLNKGDHESHTLLMCIQTGTTVSNPNRMETASEELYFKSPEEMHEAFKDYPEAIANSLKIADMCNVEMHFGELHLPTYEVPEGFETPEDYFRYLSEEGLKKRLLKIDESEHELYIERLNAEMDIISIKGYVGYFLIVWDFINYARKNDIPVGPGRGSGAGSLVAYSLGITDIDPIKLKLLFERFLNPERPSLPDFDIDFCVKRRDEVIQYVRDKYGHDRVSQIITFGKLSGRSVVRDVCRVLEIPLKDADLLAKSIPEAPGMTLTYALEIDPGVKEAFDNHPAGRDILRHSLNLEGLLRQAGMHAAGVVIADKPLTEYVPLCRGKSKDGESNGNIEILAQYEKGLLEKMGLVKFDFLGLANLTIINETVKRIHREVDKEFDLSSIPYDDQEVYEMLSNGDSTGVFQLESGGMRRLMRKLKPSVLEDIIALNALFRPGPIGSGMLDLFCDRKHGVEPIVYDLPELESILKETYGVIVYQEQVMEIARVVAGYSLGSADILRRAMGGKDEIEMARQRKIFIEGDEKLKIPGARKLGFEVKSAESIFDLMANFAKYGFNKSHSAAYAVVAYQTAYLRRKFAPQFLSAAMSAEESKLEKIIPYIEDARQMGIDVCPPNVNISGAEFEYIDGAVWFGLKSIKNVGAAAVEYIINERKKNGKYKSIYDFCDRVDLRMANKKVLESLIYAGAFDCFGKNRKQLLQVLESCMEQSQVKQHMKENGILSIEQFLFDDEEDNHTDEFYPDVDELPEAELLSLEKSVLSIYFTSHPVMNAAKISNYTFHTAEFVNNSSSGEPVKMLGIIKSMKRLLTNKNDPVKKKESMAAFVLEDLTGTVEAVIFPRAYSEYSQLITVENIVVVEGVWKKDGDRSSIQVNRVYNFTEALEHLTDGLSIQVDMASFDKVKADNLYTVIKQHPGNMKVRLTFMGSDGYSASIDLKPEHSIKPVPALFSQLDDYIAKGCYCVMSDNVEKQSEMFIFEDIYMQECEESY